MEIPASNSPVPPAMMRIAQSAWEVPVIMFLMKSRCPGASITYADVYGSASKSWNEVQKNTNRNHVLRSLELPKSDIDGDTTLTLSLELVEHPGCNDTALRFESTMSV